MKVLLGDNQFFGINHYDLQKGNLTKEKFINKNDIEGFIKQTQVMGLDGFMINSNKLGYEIVRDYKSEKNEEIHYSIPYPHKYASLVNEEGMLNLLKYFLSNTSIINLTITLPKFLITRNIKYLIPLVTGLEIPSSLPKGSTVYIQNVITDMLIGIKRFDVLEAFTKDIRKRGYKPGFITLNPIMLDDFLKKSSVLNKEDLTVCFNINHVGFNVFPNKKLVENYIKSNHKYNLMGMSIFSSGGANINESIKYIKSLKLDYVVFGSSKLENIETNFQNLKK
ncbi:hypothetical protein [Polaribacter vadi]|uniref:hypothetical protein n=1 Tax=Polaribacter vadi TaxID=1774273 RepID=UPI0030ECE40E|tara:strand:+ start:21593 stop:22432 length:840 start_codon:yes stop_codon:yes gene_type:complete